MTKRERRHIAELEKRKACLEIRISRETTSETANQKREKEAIEWVLEIIKDYGKERD